MPRIRGLAQLRQIGLCYTRFFTSSGLFKRSLSDGSEKKREKKEKSPYDESPEELELTKGLFFLVWKNLRRLKHIIYKS